MPRKQVSKYTEQNLMINLHIAYKLQKTSRIFKFDSAEVSLHEVIPKNIIVRSEEAPVGPESSKTAFIWHPHVVLCTVLLRVPYRMMWNSSGKICPLE